MQPPVNTLPEDASKTEPPHSKTTANSPSGADEKTSSKNVRTVLVFINGWPGTGKLTVAKAIKQIVKKCSAKGRTAVGADEEESCPLELAAGSDCRVVDNHTVFINPVDAMVDRGHPLYQTIRETVRVSALNALTQTITFNQTAAWQALPVETAHSSAPESTLLQLYIITWGLNDSPLHLKIIGEIQQCAKDSNANFCSAFLFCSPEENERRLLERSGVGLKRMQQPQEPQTHSTSHGGSSEVTSKRPGAGKLGNLDQLRHVRSKDTLLHEEHLPKPFLHIDVTELEPEDVAQRILTFVLKA